MDITCKIIRDLLPLYHDNVCSEDSCKLVEEHLSICPKCKSELEEIDIEIKGVSNMEDINVMNGIAKRWRKDKVSAFLMGGLLLSIIACIGCLVSFNVIGSYVAADGTLVEPFAFIPLFFIFAFIALLLGIILGIMSIVKRKRILK